MLPISKMQQTYLSQIRRHRYRIILIRLFLILAFLFLWELSAQLHWIDSFIFSSPSRVCTMLWKMCQDYSLFYHTGITLAETLVSFFLTILLGLGCSVLLWYQQSVSEVLEPYLVILNSLPKSALAPLLIVWLGANTKTIIVAGISVAIFGTILNLYTSFLEMDPEKIKLIYTLNGTRKDALFKVVIPGTIPLFISILKVNIGLCLVGVIIGEFIGSRMGLGYLIIYGSQTFQLTLVITSIVILCLISLCLYLLLAAAEKTYQKRTVR
ncbi:MAG: ABC transporter permease [Lachnospiraceae bacterium]|nr:ABC transporter permease [Lachnospiraceae bacterium]MDD3795341.1 ABC transporter permease [Lachnospiraceae bacterium]